MVLHESADSQSTAPKNRVAALYNRQSACFTKCKTSLPILDCPADTTLSPLRCPMCRWTQRHPQKGLIVTAKARKSTKTAQAKSAKAAEATKSKPANLSHVPTPWLKLKQMWEAGESYEAMAKATDVHYSAKKPDPTKPTRAKIWKARNIGVKIDGKLVRFGARGKAKGGPKKGKTAKGVKKVSGKAKEIKKKPKAPAAVEANAEPSNNPEPVIP